MEVSYNGRDMPDYVSIPLIKNDPDNAGLIMLTGLLEYLEFTEDENGLIHVSKNGEVWYKTDMSAYGLKKLYKDRKKFTVGERRKKKKKELLLK